MKLSICVPHYKEEFEEIKPLLDSIELQQNLNLKEDLEVIIVNDGDDVVFDKKWFDQFTFPVKYIVNEHKGVSATRNACLDNAEGEYVMFCDADDMFCSNIGLYMIFREIDNGGFDSLVSVFMEEGRIPNTQTPIYFERGRVEQGIDSTFVHGKIHRRKYLTENNIRWNENLTIHEDSYFNILCQKLTSPDRVKYCPFAFYLWKWRDASVCRHDPKYILKTYNNMLESSTALIVELMKRNKYDDAQRFAVQMIFDSYYTMNKDEWINQENKEYRDATEKRFKRFYLEFKDLFDKIKPDEKNAIIVGVRNRFFQEGMMLESVTFNDWIEHILEIK